MFPHELSLPHCEADDRSHYPQFADEDNKVWGHQVPFFRSHSSEAKSMQTSCSSCHITLLLICIH